MKSFSWKQLYQITKRIRPSKKRIFNIQNIDGNECFKWCLVRHLNPADHHPARIIKVDKDFAKTLDFKNINFPVKIRDIHKIENKNPSALAFLVMKIRKGIQSMYQENVAKKNRLTYC